MDYMALFILADGTLHNNSCENLKSCLFISSCCNPKNVERGTLYPGNRQNKATNSVGSNFVEDVLFRVEFLYCASFNSRSNIPVTNGELKTYSKNFGLVIGFIAGVLLCSSFI
jgi:hypothetical protein